jgi:plastocyanin
MQWSQVRFTKQYAARSAAAVALALGMGLPSVPAAAQPLTQTSPVAATPADCVIQLSVANPSPGGQEIPRSVEISGIANDEAATVGNGISHVQAFLGNRDTGGLFLGSTTVSGTPGNWSLTTTFPANLSGGQNLFVYGTSSISGQQAFVSVPIVLAGTTSEVTASDQSQTFCPAVMPPVAPISPPVVPPTVVPPPLTPSVPAQPPTAMGIQLTISSPLSPPLIFSTGTLTAPAGVQVTVTYNNDSPIPHNWHVFNGPDASSGTLATTQIITGPGASDSVTFTTPSQPGSYFFWCDVHPSFMTGEFVVTSQ